MKFSAEDFLSKSDQIRRKLRIWSYLMEKFLMENFIFFAFVLDFRTHFSEKKFILEKMTVSVNLSGACHSYVHF